MNDPLINLDDALVKLASGVPPMHSDMYNLLWEARLEIKYLRQHIEEIAKCDRVASTTMAALVDECSVILTRWNGSSQHTAPKFGWEVGKDE